MPDVDVKTIGTILGLLGSLWAYLRHTNVRDAASAAADAVKAAVLAEVEHALLDDPDGTANVAEGLLRDAAAVAVQRLHVPDRLARPMVRLAVQAGMSEVRRRLAEARARGELKAGGARLYDAAASVQSALERAEAEGYRRGAALRIDAPGGAGAAVEPASGSGDNGAGSEAPPAPLLSGTREG